ncbi:response regulator receiver domain [Hymenobacter metallilatus]|uniref:Response receiver domain-containing protein n=1 Tax=Hymenobacter metallilatus TaxID=2493666 RepID=A0A3R9M7C6_9BACT|nr:response regulator receiver domain [Hymenobacter metallilatus]RSK23943.1 hypothetical protein EI290_21385 [Hymenobacter metallilatus]
MSPQNAYKKFHIYSQGIAAEFLQSVVVVDDKAQTNPETKKATDDTAPTAGLSQPGRGGRKQVTAKSELVEPIDNTASIKQTEDLSTPPAPTEPISPMPQLKDAEVLPIKALNEAFAQHGIVCGFLSPAASGTDREEIIKRVVKSAKRADIVILDWKMERGERAGSTALEIIDNILKSDDGKRGNSFQSRGRLRLIVIYSQTIDLAGIASDIYNHLNKDIKPEDSFKRLDDFSLNHESTRICVFRKSGGTASKDGRTYDVNALTDKIIDEFTLLTEGLLSNVAIEALSALRQNTHKILQKFNSGLDAPYLTHRALTNPSEETQSHPIALLASEMQDVLEGNGITDSVSPDRIKLWLRSLPERILPNNITVNSKFRNMTVENQLDFVADAVENGVHEPTDLSATNSEWTTFINKLKSPKKDEHSDFTNLMLADMSGASKDREFSMLTTIRSHYTTPPPYLNLGTVIAIRKGAVSEYYVCIQPVCDCVRLECATRFPFLKLELPPKPDPAKPKQPKFDFIIRDGANLLELKVDYKPYNMELISFTPDHKLIKAEQVAIEGNIDNKEWVFTGTTDSGSTIQCVWLADLKFAHAQRIAGRFGSEITRVGLTESEWLRRMAG